ncbi:MAG: sodium/proton-translocating pyrophosphatase, partial [Bacteroidales bacterium]|nr:sodium/proton-translocating pyrophosphatase [Bacteroidales bacterium]
MKKQLKLILAMLLLLPASVFAGDADLVIPDLKTASFFNGALTGWDILFYGLVIVLVGLYFGFMQFRSINKMPSHKSMLDVSETIYKTCKTYLLQQGRFLAILFVIIAVIMAYYFLALSGMNVGKVAMILGWSVLGVLGSYSVAWFGIRINTLANARTSFASLRGKPWDVVAIPLKSGMSIGLMLVSVELLMMIAILLFVPGDAAGACFLGFAIGESLGASALRIAGGIFTKIADIGADLMKIVFNLPEDDPRNPGVIADCTGDNAGDSVGPTADGFETYGVTGVALVSFIVLAMHVEFQASLIVWIFAMRLLMMVTSMLSYGINHAFNSKKYSNSKEFDFENPLSSLIWITSVLSVVMTYLVSWMLLGTVLEAGLWWKLATIISCGTAAAAIIPELTKAFTSSKSRHVQEIVTASREGGPSLNILSGLVAGNFSAFWKGMVMMGLMFIAFL